MALFDELIPEGGPFSTEVPGPSMPRDIPSLVGAALEADQKADSVVAQRDDLVEQVDAQYKELQAEEAALKQQIAELRALQPKNWLERFKRTAQRLNAEERIKVLREQMAAIPTGEAIRAQEARTEIPRKAKQLEEAGVAREDLGYAISTGQPAPKTQVRMAERKARGEARGERMERLAGLTEVYGSREAALAYMKDAAAAEVELTQAQAKEAAARAAYLRAGGDRPETGADAAAKESAKRQGAMLDYRSGVDPEASMPADPAEWMLSQNRFETKADARSAAGNAVKVIAAEYGSTVSTYLATEFGVTPETMADMDPGAAMAMLQRAEKKLSISGDKLQRAYRGAMLRQRGVHDARTFLDEVAFGVIAGTVPFSRMDQVLSYYGASDLNEGAERIYPNPALGPLLMEIRQDVQATAERVGKIPLSRGQIVEGSEWDIVMQSIRDRLMQKIGTEPAPARDEGRVDHEYGTGGLNRDYGNDVWPWSLRHQQQGLQPLR